MPLGQELLPASTGALPVSFKPPNRTFEELDRPLGVCLTANDALMIDRDHQKRSGRYQDRRRADCAAKRQQHEHCSDDSKCKPRVTYPVEQRSKTIMRA